MIGYKKNSITRKLIIQMILVSSIVTILALGLRFYERYQTTQLAFETTTKTISERIKQTSADALWDLDAKSLRKIFETEITSTILASIQLSSTTKSYDMWVIEKESSIVNRTEQNFSENHQKDFTKFSIMIYHDELSPKKEYLGSVTLWFDNSGNYSYLYTDLFWNFIIVLFVVSTLTFFISNVIIKKIVRPIDILRKQTAEAAVEANLGDFKSNIKNRLNKNAIEELTLMASNLDKIFLEFSENITLVKKSQLEVASVNENLEHLILERTKELENTNENLKETLSKLERTQSELVQNAQLVVLGRLVASIAHEINTPLGAIISANSNIEKLIDDLIEEVFPFYVSLNEQQRKMFNYVMKTSSNKEFSKNSYQDRVFFKKYSDLIKSMGVIEYFEIASAVVDSGLRPKENYLEKIAKTENALKIFQLADKIGSMSFINKIVGVASNKVNNYLLALNTYSRKRTDEELQSVELKKSLETVFMLFQHKFKHNIKLVTNFGQTPNIICKQENLDQVWTNIISNAVHAMKDSGTLTVSTKLKNDLIQVSIEDNGPGIPKEIQDKIFTPFFTTKIAGEGTGLGLDIVKRILKEIDCDISFTSKPGQTIFTVFLKVKP